MAPEKRERRGRVDQWMGGEGKETSKGKYFSLPAPNYFFFN